MNSKQALLKLYENLKDFYNINVRRFPDALQTNGKDVLLDWYEHLYNIIKNDLDALDYFIMEENN